jgi:hypothetical protein
MASSFGRGVASSLPTGFTDDLAKAAKGDFGPEAKLAADAFMQNSAILVKFANAKLATNIIADQAGVLSASLKNATSATQIAADLGRISSDMPTAITNIKSTTVQAEKDAMAIRVQQLKAAGKGTDEATEIALLERGQSRFGRVLTGVTTTGAIIGLTFGALAIYALASADDTDGVTIPINNITIIDSNHVQVDYDPPYNQHDAFCITVGDSLDFSCAVGACMVTNPAGQSLNGVRVSEIKSDSSCIVELSLTSAGGLTLGQTSAPGAVGSPGVASGQSYWGHATVHTNTLNQFLGGLGTVAGGLGGTLNVLTNTALGPGGVIPTIINAAGDAANSGFCHLVPFMCSSNLLWTILGFIGFIILCVIGYYLLKSSSSGKGE